LTLQKGFEISQRSEDMKRRTFLTTATAALGTGAIAGCLADDDGSGSDGDGTGTAAPTETTSAGTPTSTPTPQSESESIASTTLEATGDCSNTGTASVDFESSDVVVTGCIQGPNGCHQPVLQGATMDGETLEVVVTTEEQGGDVCTQALVQRSYEATVGFDGTLPATVTVVHDRMGERTTVTTADR
jgi:hypothetical protein